MEKSNNANVGKFVSGSATFDGEELMRNMTTHINKRMGKGYVWLELSEEKRQEVSDTFCAMFKALKVENPDDSIHIKVSPRYPMCICDINTKSTTYAGAAGASTKELPRVISNFRPLVVDSVFDGVNISIPYKVVGKTDLVNVVTIGVPSLTEDDFTKEIIHVEYEWRPPRCDLCKIFGHVYDDLLKRVASPLIVTTSNVITPTVEKSNDGFQTVGKNKKRKGKSKSTNGGQFVGPSVKPNVRYEPNAITSAPKKGATNVGNASKSSTMSKTTGTSSKNYNIITSNSYYALNEEEDEENVYDEAANLFPNTKTVGSSSFMVAAS
ncbi:hypothetical protein Tco_0986949 [Tanacetum coccineum]